MSLVLEIEFLTGVCRAARGPEGDTPDWPPQPDRVFSALVSAWGTRGELPEERVALEWLEKQPTPEIRASEHSTRTAPRVYVPPNDFQSSKAMKTYRKVLPEYRPRQPRRFPVARPDDPNMELVWINSPSHEILDALNALARCVGYIGHSASLTRCHFLVDHARSSHLNQVPCRHRIYPGRLQELEQAHHARPERPTIRPGEPVFHEGTPAPQIPTEWLVLEVVKGTVPDIRASALVCRLLRQTLMAGYRRVGMEGNIPEVISGHAPDDTPSRHPHLAFAPMAFMGSPYADGRVFGFALIPPRGQSLLQIEKFRDAFEAIAKYHPADQRRFLSLKGSPLRRPLVLAPVPANEATKQSLSPACYLTESSRWASVTPIVLERHLKKNNDAEVRELVARSCENAKLPRPDINKIRVSKHSAVEGAPAARPLAGEPSWTKWQLPKSLESRRLVHAVIEFEESISGPVILGAGRFTGLGLCRSVRS